MRRPGIRALLTAWFALAVLLIVTPFTVIVLTLHWRTTRSALDHHLREDLEVAVKLLRRTPAGIQWAYAESHDPGYDAGELRWVEVYDNNGRLLFARGAPEAVSHQQTWPAPRADREMLESVTMPSGARVRLYTSPRIVDKMPLVVRVGRSEEDILAEWRRLVAIFALTVPVAILAAAVTGFVLAGRALAPIAHMTERARSISAEHLHERLSIENPYDELGRLAAVFNETFERIEQSFERLKRFSLDASHELRTPLTAIRSVGEVGLSEPRSETAYREIIGSMLEEVDRLTRLVNSLLTLSRWEAGPIRLRKEPVDLTDLARNVIAQLAVLAEDKAIEIQLRDSGPVLVLCDREMVRQAVINIVDNAIKYSPAGGHIEITTSRTNGACELHVADEGPGIEPEHIDRVFDAFYRVDKARSRDTDGVGLGLSIARRAVLSNDGRLVVQSEVGRGSRFTIAFAASDVSKSRITGHQPIRTDA